MTDSTVEWFMISIHVTGLNWNVPHTDYQKCKHMQSPFLFRAEFCLLHILYILTAVCPGFPFCRYSVLACALAAWPYRILLLGLLKVAGPEPDGPVNQNNELKEAEGGTELRCYFSTLLALLVIFSPHKVTPLQFNTSLMETDINTCWPCPECSQQNVLVLTTSENNKCNLFLLGVQFTFF